MINWYIWSEIKQTTEATKLSADAAAASTAAWIAVDGFGITSIDKDQITFEIGFKNIGKTPALKAESGWEFSFINPSGPYDLTNIPKFDPYKCPKATVHVGILPPDKVWGTKLHSGTYGMSEAQEQMVRNRTAKLFIHGCATYHDVLTDKERITEVGAYFPGTSNPSDIGVYLYYPYNRMK